MDITNVRTLAAGGRLSQGQLDRLRAARLLEPGQLSVKIAEVDGQAVVWQERELGQWELDFGGGSLADALAQLTSLMGENEFFGTPADVEIVTEIRRERFDADREVQVLKGWRAISPADVALFDSIVAEQKKAVWVRNQDEQRVLLERLSYLQREEQAVQG